MKQKCVRRLLGLIVALGLLLSGCGAPENSETPASAASSAPVPQPPQATAAGVPQSTQPPQEQTGYGYRTERTELSRQPAGKLLELSGTMYMEAMGGSSQCLVALEDCVPVPAELEGEMAGAAADGQQLWYCVRTGEGLSMVPVQPDGAASDPIALEGTEKLYPMDLAVGGDGCFYLLDFQTLYTFHADGKQASALPLGGSGRELVRLGNGQVLLNTWKMGADGHGAEGGTLALVSTESIGASLTDKALACSAYSGWDSTVLLSVNSGLYTLDTETGEMAPLLDWVDCGVDPGSILTAAALGPERIEVVTSEAAGFQRITLSQVPASELEEGTVLNLGLWVEDQELCSALRTLTVEFNETADFRIHLVDYGSYGDGAERLRSDAEDLDLILADGLADVELLDLQTLFDEELGRETLAPWVASHLDSNKGLPLYVTVQTLLGSKTVLGETQGWTPAELAEKTGQYPNAAVLRYSNAYDTLDALLGTAGAYVTDYGSLLAALKGLPVEEEAIYELPANVQTQAVPCLMDGSLLLEPVTITGFSDLLAIEAAMGGDGVLKGYPVNEGNGGVLVASAETVGIPAASAHPQEAWTFLKALVTSQTTAVCLQDKGLPILEERFEELEAEAMKGLTYTDESGQSAATGGQVSFDGASYETQPLTQAQADAFRDYLAHLSGFAAGGSDGSAREALRTVIEDGVDPKAAASALN